LAEKSHLDSLSLQHAARHVLDQEPRAHVDYVEIVDAKTFQPVANVSRPAYVLVAATFGETRLLDNLLITFREDGSQKGVVTEL
jgi:pantoate--beta-alanine ligase